MSLPFNFRVKSSLISWTAFGVVLASHAIAAPLSYTTPNVITTAGATSVTFNGQTFVNQGLQGVARLPATTTLDFNGDTFGAFSSLDVVPGSWRKTATGYTGTLFSLPDRGPNGVGSVTFSDYAGRVSSFTMNFNPYTSGANLPVSADSQHQLVLTQTGGYFFKDFNGKLTTGLDPGAGATAFVTQNGMSLPGSTTGAAAGKISLDAEGLRFLNNGTFYVSDEYGANVYYFDKTGNMRGVIQPPPALIPNTASGLSFTSLTDATTGRRLNQGIEGMAVTPDNKKLVTLLQSATMQDSNTNQQTRTNTRLMIYDISKSNTPTTPVADYVLQLPVYTSTGNGTAVNRTAAQSELLALNDSQFLVLSRDSNGLGQALLNPVFKSVLLIDTAGATNIAGTTYETTTTPISPGGVLNAGIVPVSQVEVVNILNTTQLGKFGLNINNVTPTSLTLTEKLEGMALVPVLDENAPQDYFLLVGNDNDFLSSTCKVGGQDCSQAVNSDALVLVYRLTLPTYVDSQHLQAMLNTAPSTLGNTTQAAREMAVLNASDIAEHLLVQRHANMGTATSTGANVGVWAAGDWLTRSQAGQLIGTRTNGGIIGIDARFSDGTLLGAAWGYYQGNPKSNGAFDADYDSNQFSIYASFHQGGFHLDLTGTHGATSFTEIKRAGAYGLTALGNTDGSSTAYVAEAGYLFDTDKLHYGPLAGIRKIQTSIGTYVETGASGGDINFPQFTTDGSAAYLGGEASMQFDQLRAIVRLTWSEKDSIDDATASVRLASAANAMGTQTVNVAGLAQAFVEPSLTLSGGDTGKWSWWLNYAARIGDEEGTEHRATAGLRMKF